MTLAPVRRIGGIVLAISFNLLLALLLLSVFLGPTNSTVRAALVAFCILAMARPADAVLVTSALLGFGIILSHLAGTPDLRVSEVLVVASVAGCCVRALWDQPLRDALMVRISAPIILLALTAAASTVVWLRIYQFQTEYASEYIGSLFHYLMRAYFVERGEFAEVVSTGVILEGLALFVVVSALCRVDASFFERALRMFTLGGAAVAVMSVVRLGEILLRNPAAIDALQGGALRISPQVADLIAAGAYFSLCLLGGVGLALAGGKRRLLWIASSVPVLAGLYLTGSRSVIAALLAGLAVPLFVLGRQHAAVKRTLLVFASVAAIMVISYPFLTGRDIAGQVARLSIETRIELARTSARVIATRPLFGVGIDRYHLSAGFFASPRLNSLWPARKNPHNDFLRIGAELGLVALALFVWILTRAGQPIAWALNRTPDTRFAGLVGGLLAFFITMLVSDPLMVREVSYAFWIALGLGVGYASSNAVVSADATPVATTGARSNRTWQRWIPAVVAVFVVASVPYRASRELSRVDVRRIRYGLHDSSTTPDGTVFWWTGPRATLFVNSRARLIEIPLSSGLPAGALQHVGVSIDGRPANRISVGPEWQRLRTPIPIDRSRRYRRIDLTISPLWTPAEVVPGSQDTRKLGVRLGEVKVITAAFEER